MSIDKEKKTEFETYILKILDYEKGITHIQQISYGETPCKQMFAFVLSVNETVSAPDAQFEVRLFVDEDYKNADVIKSVNCQSRKIVKIMFFHTVNDAQTYILGKMQNYRNAIFEKKIEYRIIPMPENNFADHIKPGVIIQRPCGASAHHQGVIVAEPSLEEACIAHFDTENGSGSLKWVARDAYVRLDTIKQFLRIGTKKECSATILVPCFKRLSQEEICERAKCFAANEYGRGNFNIFRNNCQHFASNCVYGTSFVEDAKRFDPLNLIFKHSEKLRQKKIKKPK